jgi:hypothetical protein
MNFSSFELGYREAQLDYRDGTSPWGDDEDDGRGGRMSDSFRAGYRIGYLDAEHNMDDVETAWNTTVKTDDE